MLPDIYHYNGHEGDQGRGEGQGEGGDEGDEVGGGGTTSLLLHELVIRVV